MTFKPRVTVMEPDSRLEWLVTLGIPGLFDGRHSFTLSPTGVAATRFVQAEEFSGEFSGPSSRSREGCWHGPRPASKR